MRLSRTLCVMPNYQERGQEGKENRNALRLSFPRGQTVAKDFENLSAEKRGDFQNILPQIFEPTPTCEPRDHLRLPVPPGPNVGTRLRPDRATPWQAEITPSCPAHETAEQGLAISPCKQTKPDTRCKTLNNHACGSNKTLHNACCH